MIADLRAMNEETNQTKLQHAIRSLSTQWDQREVMPPYIETISGLFSATVMRKPGRNESQTSGAGVNTKGNNPLNKKSNIPTTNRPKSPRKPVPAHSPMASQSQRSGYANSNR